MRITAKVDRRYLHNLYEKCATYTTTAQWSSTLTEVAQGSKRTYLSVLPSLNRVLDTTLKHSSPREDQAGDRRTAGSIGIHDIGSGLQLCQESERLVL